MKTLKKVGEVLYSLCGKDLENFENLLLKSGYYLYDGMILIETKVK